jgi:(+)-trans-carveol dehydrogenase
MTGWAEGKVVLVTGAARGQGRNHAIRFAQEGAAIIAIDVCDQLPEVQYPMSTEADLEETAQLVGQAGAKIFTAKVDIRDHDAMSAAVASGVAELGGLDIVVANAGVTAFASSTELTMPQWQTTVDVNLTGSWVTASVAIPHLLASGKGGSITFISSAAGLRAYANMPHYMAAKHGVVGLMRGLAVELASANIRVNSVHPTTVNTPMVHNDATYNLFFSEDTFDRAVLEERFKAVTLLDTPWVESDDISEAVLYLSSDRARFVTGITMPVDAGAFLK